MSHAEFLHEFSVSPEHPVWPGHFPTQALVPGVLMLEHVASALRQWRGQRLSRVVEAKFLAALAPDQRAELRLSAKGERIGFEIRHAGALLARGMVEAAT